MLYLSVGLSGVVSLDVFAGHLFWLTSGKEQVLYKQDKFGRGVKLSMLGHLRHAASVKVFYPHQYYSQSKYHTNTTHRVSTTPVLLTA